MALVFTFGQFCVRSQLSTVSEATIGPVVCLEQTARSENCGLTRMENNNSEILVIFFFFLSTGTRYMYTSC